MFKVSSFRVAFGWYFGRMVAELLMMALMGLVLIALRAF